MAVRRTTWAKGTNWQNTSQISSILMSDAGGKQTLHLADEDCGHHQHCGQVHTQGRLKEEGLEEGGGKCDCNEEERGEKGGQHLACDLPLQNYKHTKALSI